MTDITKLSQLCCSLAEALRGVLMMEPAAISAADKALAAYAAAQSAPSEPAQGEREAFEAWCKANSFAVREKLPDGRYFAPDTEWCWQAWRACHALAQQPAASVALTEAQLDSLCAYNRAGARELARLVERAHGITAPAAQEKP